MAELLKLIIAVGELVILRLSDLFAGSFDKVFLQILDMTVVGSAVILAVLLLRLALHRQPKLLSYVLWGVVLLRLLVPWSPEAPWGLTVPEIENYYTLSNDEIALSEAASVLYEHVGDAVNGGLEIYQIELEQPLRNGSNWVSAYWWEVWILFGRYIWGAGVVVMLLYSLISLLRLRKKLLCAMPLQQTAHWSDSAVHQPSARIYLADGIQTPMVIGLFRPKIYLPSTLSEEEQQYVLLHERHHIRRGDQWWRLLGYLALCLHWFNPLVWLAFSLACRDMEMSCDEAVLRKLGDEARRGYSASLLNLTTGKKIVSPIPLAFGEGSTSERIKHIMTGKKPVIWSVVLASLFLVMSGLFLLTDRSTEQKPMLGASYQTVQVLYDTEQGPALPENGPQYYMTEDRLLYQKESHSAQWEELGRLEAYPLTKSELQAYTPYEKGWLTAYRLRAVREAYILRMEQNVFCLAIRTENGHTLLGFGWEDIGERGQGASDDTGLQILYRLEQIDTHPSLETVQQEEYNK